ncbi:MAG TPA: condensation domain-containing protein, partial [Blastocatellia bacterium]
MNLPYTRVYGGANKSNRSLAEGLAERGHAVRVIAPALATPSPISHEQFLEELTAESVRVSSKRGVDFFTINRVDVQAVVESSHLRTYLIEQIREHNPDWILVSSEDQSQSLLQAALGTYPGRVIYLAHTPQMLPFGPASLYPGEQRTKLIGQAAAIGTISNFVADYIKQWAGFEAFTNHPPHFGPGPFPYFGNFDDGYVLLMNASAVKGISIFLALAKEMPGVEFATIKGYGTTSSDLAAISELPNVTLLENRKNLDDILGQTRILLMPSLWVEGFGMAVVDAMLRGIPVLASNFGGLVEAKLGTDYLLPVRPITAFETRLDENLLPVPIVPEQDITPWRDALGGLLSDRRLYEQQSQSARDAALKFVSSLSVGPLERFLSNLNGGSRSNSKGNSHNLKEKDSSSSHASAGGRFDEIADLTPEQKALLMLRLQKKSPNRAEQKKSTAAIQRAPRSEKLPLSFAQERLWFIDQLEPGSATYNISTALRLVEELDVRALERALSEIMRRHEILRTVFPVEEGEPAQVIKPTQEFKFDVEDLSWAREEKRGEEVERISREEATRGFDLQAGPLMRVRMLRLAEDEHVLVVTMHHIISDGWSIGVIIREVAALYEAYSRGEESPLKELEIQYADYAGWQREWLRGEELDKQMG